MANFCSIDKSTVTKSIQKLEEQGFIQLIADSFDKRIRKLYTTNKASDVMNEFYKYRNDFYEKITGNYSITNFETTLKKIANNSKKLSEVNTQYHKLRIGFLQKLTLIDYPEKVACTIFLAGCNFKCPFCYNKDLVFIPENFEFFDPEKILAYTEKRQGVLEGVCITGGEPLLQNETIAFIQALKNQNYKVKLDTNGNYPDKLIYLIENKLIDYVSIDIKNSKKNYAKTVGLNENAVNIDNISKSIDYVMNSNIEYEFRTTVVSNLHNEDSFVDIAKWIQGAKAYYLQKYEPNENVIQKGLSAPSNEELKKYRQIVLDDIPNTILREI